MTDYQKSCSSNLWQSLINLMVEFEQCIMKNVVSNRATNVSIKFISFINDMYKKIVFEGFSSTNTWTLFGCLWEFLICGSKLWIRAGCLSEKNLQRKHNRLIHLLCWRYPSPKSWYYLLREKFLMAHVVASVALY